MTKGTPNNKRTHAKKNQKTPAKRRGANIRANRMRRRTLNYAFLLLMPERAAFNAHNGTRRANDDVRAKRRCAKRRANERHRAKRRCAQRRNGQQSSIKQLDFGDVQS